MGPDQQLPHSGGTHVGILAYNEELLRSCASAVTHPPPATTRRPPLSSSASSGRGNTGRYGRTGRGADRHPRNASPLELGIWIAVGSFVGPNQAVSGPTPGTYGLDNLCLFAGISSCGCRTNTMLHTREVAGSKPAAPITRKAVQYRGFRRSSPPFLRRAYWARAGIGSASAARPGGAGKGSAKYWVSCVTRPSVISMTLSEYVGTPS
jgi:hypothetical protein